MKVNGTDMSMINGDDEQFAVSIEGLPFVTGDTVYFSVKEKLSDSSYILQKTITSFNVDGEAVVVLASADTQSLETKAYLYDIQVTYLGGAKTTLVEPSSFTLKRGVTHD